jgi:hypothetical protein
VRPENTLNTTKAAGTPRHEPAAATSTGKALHPFCDLAKVAAILSKGSPSLPPPARQGSVASAVLTALEPAAGPLVPRRAPFLACTCSTATSDTHPSASSWPAAKAGAGAGAEAGVVGSGDGRSQGAAAAAC